MWSTLLLCACGCVHVSVCSSMSCCRCTAVWHKRMKICVCRGIFSVTTPRQVVNSTLWPLTHSMLSCDSPSCYISLGQEFTVHPSMSGEAWCLFLERLKRKRSEAMKQVCCQQRAGRFIIWSLPSHPDLVSANLTVAFSSTWPSRLSSTLSSKCWCPTSGLQTTVPWGRTNIISSSNSAVNDLTHNYSGDSPQNPPTVDHLGFHIIPKINTLWIKAWSQCLVEVILQQEWNFL